MNLKTIAGCLLLIFVACKHPKPKPKEKPVEKTASTITGSWQLFDLAPDGIKTRLNDSMVSDPSLRRIPAGEMATFFLDGVMSDILITGSYDTGRWQYSKDHMHLLMAFGPKKSKTSFYQEVVSGKQVLNTVDVKTHLRARYLRYGEGVADVNQDPFYPTNNVWRKPPAHSETDKEIRQRLENYFKHLLCILKISQLRKQDQVSFEFSNGIVQIYEGGIGIKDSSEISVTWEHCFFSKKEADKAYSMFQQYLKRSSYKGKGTGNWVTDDYNILFHMYTDLQQGKFTENASANNLSKK